jgi:NADH-quinone oxidoreductase subunit M
MNFLDFLLNPLNLVTFFPLVGVLVILFINRENSNAIRWIALIASTLTFGISGRSLISWELTD